MPRFVIQGLKTDDDYRLLVVDTKTGLELGRDGGEPEDQTLGRDWAWVLDALNALAEGKDPVGGYDE